MSRLLLAAAGAIALMSAYGTAVAQDVIEGPRPGAYIGPTYHDDDYYSRRYYRGYRYYGYGYRGSAHERRVDRNTCGRYAYFDGHTCQPGRRPY
jgi:hypothetical protein